MERAWTLVLAHSLFTRFYRNDTAEMSRQVAAGAGKPDQEYLMLALEADTAAYFGHLGRARELSRQASSSAKRAGENEISATYEAVAALREGLFGMQTELDSGQRWQRNVRVTR